MCWELKQICTRLGYTYHKLAVKVYYLYLTLFIKFILIVIIFKLTLRATRAHHDKNVSIKNHFAKLRVVNLYFLNNAIREFRFSYLLIRLRIKCSDMLTKSPEIMYAPL